MKFDVAIVLSTGIKEDSSLPESSLACVKKAVELQKNNEVVELLFSGKWAWTLKYVPPITEARAMENYAKELGANLITIGEEGQTTVHNLCWVKLRYLKWHNYFNPVFVIPSPILKDRFEYNVKMVLGPEYNYEIAFADYQYQVDKTKQLEDSEKQKLQDCVNFYKNITPGDAQRIYELSQRDLGENYKN